MTKYIAIEQLPQHMKREKLKRGLVKVKRGAVKAGQTAVNVGKKVVSGVNQARQSSTGKAIFGYLTKLGEAQNSPRRKGRNTHQFRLPRF